MSLWSKSKSSHEPRMGMTRRSEHLAAGARLAAVVLEDAGERCNWLTMTRSVPLMMRFHTPVHQGRCRRRMSVHLMSRTGTRLGLVVDITGDKADLDAYRGFVGKTLGDTFRLIVLGLADFVADEFEAGGTVEVFDWEDETGQTFIRRDFRRPSCELPMGSPPAGLSGWGISTSTLILPELFGKLSHINFTSEKVGRQKPERARVARSRNQSCIKNATRSTTWLPSRRSGRAVVD